MSDWFKLFNTPTVEQAPVETVVPKTQYVSAPNTTIPNVYVAPGGNDYNKILDELLPQGDYSNYMSAVANLSALPLTEDQKFITAFNTIKFTKITPALIIKSAEEYKTILENESVEFNNMIAERRQTDAEKQLAIEKDQQLIQEATIRIQTSQMELTQSKLKLDGEQNSFNSVFTNKTTVLSETINKITTYLNGVK